MKYLFISGCDRSGTTALVRLLNQHEKIAVGMERYKGLINNSEKLDTLTPERFTKDNFFDIKDEETNIQWDYFYDPMKDKFDSSEYIGDKVPRYFQIYGHFEKNFPEAKHLFIIRDPFEVASSWKVRAQDVNDTTWLESNDVKRSVVVWNKSLEAAYKVLKKGSLDMIVIHYSELFSGSNKALQAILSHLNLQNDKTLTSYFSKTTSSWSERKKSNSHLTELEQNYVRQHANFSLAKHLIRNYKTRQKVDG